MTWPRPNPFQPGRLRLPRVPLAQPVSPPPNDAKSTEKRTRHTDVRWHVDNTKPRCTEPISSNVALIAISSHFARSFWTFETCVIGRRERKRYPRTVGKRKNWQSWHRRAWGIRELHHLFFCFNTRTWVPPFTSTIRWKLVRRWLARKWRAGMGIRSILRSDQIVITGSVEAQKTPRTRNRRANGGGRGVRVPLYETGTTGTQNKPARVRWIESRRESRSTRANCTEKPETVIERNNNNVGFVSHIQKTNNYNAMKSFQKQSRTENGSKRGHSWEKSA